MHFLSLLYHFHFKSERRERLFLASLGFLVTFGIVRAITHLIRAGIGPFHNVGTGGLHIHHLVWVSRCSSWSAMRGSSRRAPAKP